ncbi:helix-turn-helix transcriptional regulator [Chryseobacterium taklimakanense]|uniref:winged helix-turn-helix transcriptional regulator n=1 Tax=Chryseobacterium taklimakanense TaxID=536441 RepID=UPI001EF52E5C|nr:helix-turn-helix domain-containing protein [Chryseobacterium taklimakanense]MCG7280712.1 helix-turn-helix transcriptional regulator [Chryseobacterium taklimakanense]
MKNYRSICPLSRSLDTFGDKWTLLILRDVGLYGKTTFKELAQMQEGIATNTLADRLEKLTAEGLLTKTKSKRNKLVFHYNITEKGLDLIPIIKAAIDWSEKYLYNDEEKSAAAELFTFVRSTPAFSEN